MIDLKRILVVAVCVPSAVLAAEAPKAMKADGTFGLTAISSVEVCHPDGEREYLRRLICPAGNHPTFQRTGSIGPRNPVDNLTEAEADKALAASLGGGELSPGATDYHIIDGYEVICGNSKTIVYIDMYHCNAPLSNEAPQGFTIEK